MRRGFDAKLALSKAGTLVAISTGSDACAEHETGSAVLMGSLTGGQAMNAKAYAVSIRKKPGTKLRDLVGVALSYPDLIESRTIRSNLDKIVFDKRGEGDQVEAVLGFSALSEWSFGQQAGSGTGASAAELWNDQELSWGYRKDEEVVGAWDSRSFAVRVRGKVNVARFAEFAKVMKAGGCVFAGTFLDRWKGQSLGGVIIARRDRLPDECKAAIQKAQLEFEQNVRLNLKSRSDELSKIVQETKTSPGYLWPVWKDHEVDGEVVYALNPSYGVKAPYYGPYTFEELQRWMRAGGSGKLKPYVNADRAKKADPASA